MREGNHSPKDAILYFTSINCRIAESPLMLILRGDQLLVFQFNFHHLFSGLAASLASSVTADSSIDTAYCVPFTPAAKPATRSVTSGPGLTRIKLAY